MLKNKDSFFQILYVFYVRSGISGTILVLGLKVKDSKVAYEARLAGNKKPKCFYKYIRDTLGGFVRTPQFRNSAGTLIAENADIENVFVDSFSN